MPSRQKSRQRALQMLYMADMRGQTVEEVLPAFYGSLASEQGEPLTERDEFAETLVRGVAARRDELDALIAAHSQNWRIERMPVVDRNILRLAAHELTSFKTPPPVVIDQALELAGRFSAPDSIPFLNGVLDAICRAHAPTSGSAES